MSDKCRSFYFLLEQLQEFLLNFITTQNWIHMENFVKFWSKPFKYERFES